MSMKLLFNRPARFLITVGLAVCHSSTLGVLAEDAAAEVDAPAGDAPVEKEKEKPKWQHTGGLGLTLTSGNSDTLLLSFNWESFRKWERDELRFRAGLTYGQTDGDDTANSGFVSGSFEHLYTERFYVGANAILGYDEIAEIDYRLSLAAVAGYYFIKSEKTSLKGEIGPGFVAENKGGISSQYPTLWIGERFDHSFSERAKIWQLFNYTPEIGDWANYQMIFEIGAEADITKHFALQVMFRDLYVNQPAAGRVQNDIRLIAGLAYKFP